MTGKLALIGSGEVAPGMVRLHRRLLKEAGSQARVVFIDTPAGFELGLQAIHDRFTSYFERRLGLPLAIATYRGTQEDVATTGVSLQLIREANYLLAGPGSPSYAIRQWQGSPLFAVLVDRWRSGATLVFASSAAIALGRHALPVYEIYKVGEPPHWIPGLDVLGPFGLELAIIPHWDNAEGGTHDTRACFMGMERFELMHRLLPASATVLAIDEHTACILDVDAGQGEVVGRSGVTLIAGEEQTRLPAGTTFSLEALTPAATGAPTILPEEPSPPPELRAPAMFQAAAQISSGDLATGLRTMASAVPPDIASILALAAHQAGRMIVPAEDPARLIDLLLTARQELRAANAWAASDAIRDALVSLGIEVRDLPDGPVWERRP